MFAVIRTGGKQYRVAQGDVIAVEKLAGEPGAVIELGEVLMVGNGAEVATGVPLLAGAGVSATVVEQSRAAKIIVFKKKRRHNYRRKKGHRQYQTVLRIDDIRAAGDASPVTGRASGVEEWPAAQEGPAVEAEPSVEPLSATEAQMPEGGAVFEAEPSVEAGRPEEGSAEDRPAGEEGRSEDRPAGDEGGSHGA
jgi:large subunit ribosomal protein L21